MSKSAKRRRGSSPQRTDRELPQPSSDPRDDGYPLLSLRHVQPGHAIEGLDDRQCAQFLRKWAKRSQFKWEDLRKHERHGLGWEMLPSNQVRPKIPERLDRAKYMVFRHEGNLPMIGFRAGDAFYVLWVEANYGDVYEH